MAPKQNLNSAHTRLKNIFSQKNHIRIKITFAFFMLELWKSPYTFEILSNTPEWNSWPPDLTLIRDMDFWALVSLVSQLCQHQSLLTSETLGNIQEHFEAYKTINPSLYSLICALLPLWCITLRHPHFNAQQKCICHLQFIISEQRIKKEQIINESVIQ